MIRPLLRAGLALGLAAVAAPEALAASEHAVDGRKLGLVWVLPFAGILLSIAILPLAAPHFWHRHFGKVAAFWALAFLVPLTIAFGFPTALYETLHTALLEYIPFIILIVCLFTVAGGIVVRGNLRGSPATNTVLLAVGTVLASFVGTTGASMVMINPVLRANDDRKHNAHVFVFFIFLVSNVGGALTPLGDPPLFLGFLKGVDFFWTLKFLWQPTLLLTVFLLALFFVVDTIVYRREGHLPRDPTPDRPLGVSGLVNVGLMLVVASIVLASGVLPSFGEAKVYGVEVPLKGLARDAALVAVALVSLRVTARELRAANNFSWGPALEVAKLFAGIFLTIIPAIAILRAGKDGAMAGIVDLLTGPGGKPRDAMYFWLTGGLSSFLDNAPTYLVFFNAAGGDAKTLMGPMASTLMAVSAGAVFMGANTYIGNAPNFMVKAVAEQNGVKMPSFFGYMAWSCAILVPCFLVLTLIFFR
jgi:Na+/H+ antiporter NhaD/arsenite permease-like protein